MQKLKCLTLTKLGEAIDVILYVAKDYATNNLVDRVNINPYK